MRSAGFVGALVITLLALILAPAAQAQTFSSANLEGTWSLFQIATPKTGVNASSVRTFRSGCPSCVPITFDATGVVTDGVVADDGDNPYTVSGSLTLTAAGIVGGTLTLDDGISPGALAVQEARLLVNKHTIVGTSTVFTGVGLFTLVKLESGGAGSFTLTDDLAGDWNYHEITPSNQITNGDAAWVRGDITFHDPGGCTEADLKLPNGTPRATRAGGSGSFG